VIIAIAAVDKLGGIGRDNRIPWSVRADMKFFQEVTQGGMVLVGRKTAESILSYKKNKTGSLLPQRNTFVLSRTLKEFPGASVVKDLESFMQQKQKFFPDVILFVAGGSALYEDAFEYLDGVLLTQIDDEYECDAHLPFSIEDTRMILDMKPVKSFHTNRGVYQFPLNLPTTPEEPDATVVMYATQPIRKNALLFF
jgi:dihydrofolate reductase